MPTDPLSITRRRLLESVTTVGLAGMVGGVGTWSIFSDGELAIGTLVAGTLDLEVDGGDARQQFTIANASPGESGREVIPISNAGTIPGSLGLKFHLLECEEGDNDSAEDEPCEWDPDQDSSEEGKSGGNNKNDLAEHLQVRIGFDRDGTVGGGDTETVVPTQYVSELSFPSVHDSSHQLLSSGHAKDASHLFLEWAIDDTDTVQGETLGFGITVNLEQI